MGGRGGGGASNTAGWSRWLRVLVFWSVHMRHLATCLRVPFMGELEVYLTLKLDRSCLEMERTTKQDTHVGATPSVHLNLDLNPNRDPNLGLHLLRGHTTQLISLGLASSCGSPSGATVGSRC